MGDKLEPEARRCRSDESSDTRGRPIRRGESNRRCPEMKWLPDRSLTRRSGAAFGPEVVDPGR